MRWLARAVPFVAVLAVGSAAAQGPAAPPSSAASAWAVSISVPGRDGVTATEATAPPDAAPATGGAFAYPDDGSIVSAASTTASATTKLAANVGAQAESDVTDLSLLGGEITADAVTARAYAGTGPGGAGGNFGGSLVANLRVTGVPTVGPHVHLGDWGTLEVGTQAVDQSGPAGAHAYRGTVTELDLRLTADHSGLPAGSEIRIGYAEAAAETAPPPATTSTAPSAPATTPTETSPGPSAGDSPRDWPRRPGRAGLIGIHPKLRGGRYVFPVYGPTSYGDTYGSVRADTAYHHGDDVFGELGQPLVACADGTVFSLGWNKVGGNSLWIRDASGNQFYYAHLSAFSTQVANGAHVRAGQVIGFMGRTGDAEGTPAHLHFEVHPVSLLYLGDDGAVDPTPYLKTWQHAENLPFPIASGWAPSVPGGRTAPPPAAMLLGMRDISSADGLDPASLRRALRPPTRLVQPLVPAPVKPPVDLGAQAGAGD